MYSVRSIVNNASVYDLVSLRKVVGQRYLVMVVGLHISYQLRLIGPAI